MKDKEQYVEEMKKLAILSNRLSEFHEMNLQTFIKVAFENLDSARIEYSLPVGTDPGYVTFEIKTKKRKAAGTKKVPVAKRASDVAAWTRHLLWTDMAVEILINSKKVYPNVPKRRKSKSNSGNSATS